MAHRLRRWHNMLPGLVQRHMFAGLGASPVTVGTAKVERVVVELMRGIGRVRITPALVPTHSRSLHASSEVILRQAVLC